MSGSRFVVLGLAHVRSGWFREVAQWATSARLPVEFVKAMSVAEVQVRLQAGRGYSALLVDDTVAGVDRDLLELSRQAGCAVIVVDSGRATRSWPDLGASAVLPADLTPDDLLLALHQVATPIARNRDGAVTTPADEREEATIGYRGRLLAVTGAGGTGASTVAMALSQGLATDPRNHGMVCLADLALHAEHAMLHGAGDVVPGIVELVEAHRSGTPSSEEVRRLTWTVEVRGYQLLLGLRRHRDWTSVRPRAFEAALDGLRRAFRVVLADVTADLEGEQSTGSIDVEERNAVARIATRVADVVVVVGLPDLKGLNSLLRTTRDLLAHGVPGSQLLPVLNRAPRGPRARGELAAAFGQLLGGDHGVPAPVFLPERRRLDEVIRDGARLPQPWLAPLSRTVQAVLDSHAPEADVAVGDAELVPIQPGSLGTWSDDSSGGAQTGGTTSI